MFDRIATQAAALALSAVVTLGLLGGLETIASQQAGSALAQAEASAPVQQVVVIGHRLPRA